MSKKSQGITNRDAFFNAIQLKPIPTVIEDLGTVFLKELSALERIDLSTLREKFLTQDDTAGNLRFLASVIPLVLVDETGNKILTEEDIEPLMQSRFSAVEQIVAKAMEINGLTPAAVEEIEGNSEASTNSDTPTI